jgi:hypothetical protein
VKLHTKLTEENSTDIAITPLSLLLMLSVHRAGGGGDGLTLLSDMLREHTQSKSFDVQFSLY